MFKYLFKPIFLSFFLAGCSVAPHTASQTEVGKLAISLASLDKHIPKKEALRLSRDIFGKTAALVKAFDLASPPLYHNFLVNVGLRKKGLCYHWSDALYLYFSEKEYPHFSFHLAGANIGEYFFEHNAMVVTAKGGSVEEGIVIDPWRHSGRLYFSKVKDDKKYRWMHRPERGCCRKGMIQKGK